jgi:hypothetical protein
VSTNVDDEALEDMWRVNYSNQSKLQARRKGISLS